MAEIKLSKYNGGFITLPGSKSIAHRVLILAFLTKSNITIKNVPMSDDIEATLKCLYALGANYKVSENTVYFSYPSEVRSNILECDESGSTLRFLLPVATLFNSHTIFKIKGKLSLRPLTVYEKIMNDQNIEFTKTLKEIEVNGCFNAKNYRIKGNESSQYVTGLLFLLFYLKANNKIKVSPPVESKPYIDLTLDIFSQFGINISEDDNNNYTFDNFDFMAPSQFKVEADCSHLAFFAVLGCLKGNLTVKGINPNTKQGDYKILQILSDMGGNITIKGPNVSFKQSELHNIPISLKDCPDLGPILFVAASFAQGQAEFTNVERLRIKESNRIESMKEELQKAGVIFEEYESRVLIKGKEKYGGLYKFSSHNDHRIAMALSVFSLMASKQCSIRGYEAVNKSYDNFYDDLQKLGVKIIKPKNYLIIGLGIIGGGYAEGLSETENVFGVDTDEKTMNYAYEKGYIKNQTFDPEIIKDMDAIIFAADPESALEFLDKYGYQIKDNALVTDTFGVKANYLSDLKSKRYRGNYISHHPMAGKELSGIEHADKNVFCGANFIIVGTPKDKGIGALLEIASKLKFERTAYLTIEEHDERIAYLSELPHLIAVALVNTGESDRDNCLTGDSFKELTRIAKINDKLWSALFLENKEILMNYINVFIGELVKFKIALTVNDREALQNLMKKSKGKRTQFDEAETWTHWLVK